ncbi:MAG: cobalamin-dependent protein [Phycisphaerae bacterium]
MKKLVFIMTLSPDLELDVRQLPLGMGYLVSVIQRERPGRYEIHHVTHRIGRALDEFRPDLVAISSGSPYFGLARHDAREAKRRGILTLVGGIHVSMLPESLYPEMAVAVLGEGERTVLARLDFWEETGAFPEERLYQMPGLAFRADDGSVIKPRNLINLSEHLSADRLCRVHRKFTRLRYRSILRNILFGLYRVDLLRTAIQMAVGAVSSAARRARRALSGRKRAEEAPARLGAARRGG